MRCPACKTETPDDAPFCRQCGLTLQVNGSTPTASPEPTEAAKPRPAAAFFSPCPHCGQKVAAGAKTCPKCGKAPDEAPVTEDAKPEEQETRGGGRKGIVIAIAGVLAIAGGVALFKGKPADTAAPAAPAAPAAAKPQASSTTAPAGPVAYENEKHAAPAPQASAAKEASKESGKDRKPAENKAAKPNRSDKSEPTPAKAAAPKKDVAKETRETDRLPPREPQPPVAPPKAAPSWHEALKAQLRECEKKSYFPRTWCQDQAKRQYCEGHWNAVPECDRPDNSPQYKG